VFIGSETDWTVHELSLKPWSQSTVQLQHRFLSCYSVNSREHSSVGFKTWRHLRHVSLQLQSDLSLINRNSDGLQHLRLARIFSYLSNAGCNSSSQHVSKEILVLWCILSIFTEIRSMFHYYDLIYNFMIACITSQRQKNLNLRFLCAHYLNKRKKIDEKSSIGT